MLSRIQINNFQSHENTSLDLVPGVNVVVGKSNSGKTAIIRALYWLINNRPRGFRFHSDFTKDETSCTVKLMVGPWIELTKNKDKAVYKILDREEEYSGLGAEVPDEVSRILNINELNFSEQLEAPFLITSSAGEVGKTINRITKLERVDEWISDITTEVNSLNKSVELKEAEVIHIKNELDSLEFIEELEKSVIKLLNRQKFLNKICESVVKLGELVNNLEACFEEVKGLNEWLKVEEIFSVLEKRHQQRLKNMDESFVLNSTIMVNEQYQKFSYFASAEIRFSELDKKAFDLVALETENKSFDMLMDSFCLFDGEAVKQDLFLHCEADVGLLQSRQVTLNQHLEEKNNLSAMIFNLDATVRSIYERKNNLPQFISLYEKELRSLGKCPICSSDITEDHIQKIVEEL